MLQRSLCDLRKMKNLDLLLVQRKSDLSLRCLKVKIINEQSVSYLIYIFRIQNRMILNNGYPVHKLVLASQDTGQRRSGSGSGTTQFVDARVPDRAPFSSGSEENLTRGERKQNGRNWESCWLRYRALFFNDDSWVDRERETEMEMLHSNRDLCNSLRSL